MKLSYLCLALLVAGGSSCAQVPAPELILVHGSILTGAHLRSGDGSPVAARVSALAVTHGLVTAVGTDEEILRLKRGSTAVVDLHGGFAMPGFDDAHVHLFAAGSQKALAVDLDGAGSLAEMQARIRRAAEGAKPGSWIQGAGWDHTLWPGKTLPTRGDLDSVTGAHPAVFYRTDGHILVANSAALAAAGITSATADPAGGKIDRDASGEPTGILRETPATSLLDRKVPPPSPEERARALTAAMDDAVAHGVTSVQDYSPEWENFLYFESLERAGKLKLRVSEWQDFTLPVEVLRTRRASHAADDPMLHLGMLKAFMDGSLGSRTAALEDPYTDDAGNSGLLRYEGERLAAMSSERAAAGFQLGFHAIGDRANELALDAFSAAEQTAVPANEPAPPAHPDAAVVTESTPAHGVADLRFRVEHAQVLQMADFDRFARLGVIASMQPSHLLTDMNWAAQRLGPERSRAAYAWHSFLTHGVVLAFGTDYPVESIDPFRGLYAAVTRKNVAGTMSFEVQERISLNEAIFAYTQASAFAEFREKVKGRLEPGYAADIVVLDRDITAVAPEQMLKTRVLRTIVAGRTVYQAAADAGSASGERP